MFGTYLVELVVGMCFLFAVLGIVTSAVTEAVLSVLRTRAKHLQEWLEQWSTQLRGGSDTQREGAGAVGFSLPDLMSHPLVASHRRNDKEASYLPPDQLASAFLQSLAMPFSQTCVGQDLATAERGLRTYIDGLNGEGLRRALHGLLDGAVCRADDGTALVEALRVQTSQWLESSMARIEGWTKRHAKKISLAVALVLCLAFNVSALEVLRSLSADPKLRAEMAEAAVAYVPKVCDTETAVTTAEAKIACLNARTQDAVAALGPLPRLGIGWEVKPSFLTAKDLSSAAGGFLVWLVGVACAAFAASLGGDFWFKWIGDVVRLTGYKPPSKDPPAPPDAVTPTLSFMQRLTRRS